MTEGTIALPCLLYTTCKKKTGMQKHYNNNNKKEKRKETSKDKALKVSANIEDVGLTED